MSAHSAGTPEGEQRPSMRSLEPSRAPARTGSFRVDSDEDADLALELLRELVAQELARADKIATRIRQAFVLAAGFFAVVQTVAFGSFAGRQITSGERTNLLILAAIAGGLLVLCGLLVLASDRPYRSRNVTPRHILDAINEARAADGSIKDRLVALYVRVVEEARLTNRHRIVWAFATQAAAFASLLAVLVQLLYGLDARQAR